MNDGGFLRGARVYLSGPMYYGGAAHGGGDQGWRRRVTGVLEELGATVFNPWRKPMIRGVGDYGREGDQGQPYRESWTFEDSEQGATQRAFCAAKAWPMLHIDLRMIDVSDFMIAFCPTNIYSVGTVHEIVLARQQKKPVLFVTPPIVLPALDKLRAHLGDDADGLALLSDLEAEAPLRTNTTGIPSSWYMALIDSESFFDGFGFHLYAADYDWLENAFDELERMQPPKRPLLRHLRDLADGHIPCSWDASGNSRPNDDWLIFDL
jgi:hypothetical protein